MPDTRPRVEFDAEGVCNACRTAEQKSLIDWDSRREEFWNYVERLRPKSGPYDCLVPWSGGKDSSYIAYKLKFELGLNPLLVTFSPLIPNEVGAHNREALIQTGFDHIMVRPDQNVSRHLARRFFLERGNPKVHWDAGVNAIPVQVAAKFGIPLIFYAEHGESEYGGRLLSEEHRKIRDITEVLEHQIGDHPENWIDDIVEEKSIGPYLYPDLDEVESIGVTAMYYAYFFPWDIRKNYEYIREKIDFATAPGGRTEGTFTDFDSLDDKIDNLYYYLQFIKFGFGRAIRDASRQIQRGHMSREQGLDFVKAYDGEPPEAFLSETLDYLKLDSARYWETIDLHRNPEIWEKSGNAWQLRNPPH